MDSRFSDRHGYQAPEADITIREDAPEDVRFAVIEIARSRAGMTPKAIREIVCGVLYVPPDSNNWSERPVWEEVWKLVSACPWFRVYDIAEALWRTLEYREEERLAYEVDLNRYFRERGIGWQLRPSEGMVFRGDAAFTAVTPGVAELLAENNRDTAAKEIGEALADISRKPPDVTGAIQHSIAALECVARDATGKPNATLGQLSPDLDLPKPLDEAVMKLWGFASNNARISRKAPSLQMSRLS